MCVMMLMMARMGDSEPLFSFSGREPRRSFIPFRRHKGNAAKVQQDRKQRRGKKEQYQRQDGRVQQEWVLTMVTGGEKGQSEAA